MYIHIEEIKKPLNIHWEWMQLYILVNVDTWVQLCGLFS